MPHAICKFGWTAIKIAESQIWLCPGINVLKTWKRGSFLCFLVIQRVIMVATRAERCKKSFPNPIFPQSTLFDETGRGGGDKRARLLDKPPFLGIFTHDSLFARFPTPRWFFGILALPVSYCWRTTHSEYVSGKIERKSIQKHTFPGVKLHDIFYVPHTTPKICLFGKIHVFSWLNVEKHCFIAKKKTWFFRKIHSFWSYRGQNRVSRADFLQKKKFE